MRAAHRAVVCLGMLALLAACGVPDNGAAAARASCRQTATPSATPVTESAPIAIPVSGAKTTGATTARSSALRTTSGRGPYPTLSPREEQTAEAYRSWHEAFQASAGRASLPTPGSHSSPSTSGPPPNPPTNRQTAPSATAGTC
jgi:hypothetical protein